jgi:hypothetical protein
MQVFIAGKAMSKNSIAMWCLIGRPFHFCGKRYPFAVLKGKVFWPHAVSVKLKGSIWNSRLTLFQTW